jgi:hypothetical protein
VGVTRDIPSGQEHFEAGGGAFKPCFFENIFNGLHSLERASAVAVNDGGIS